ncbi:MAG: AAA family ATPase [Acidobacteriia bacterium]|nr:AAA family ATPase [Terriglobia bacterium]
MRIAQIQIENFRGIQNATLVLPKHGVLFGSNNVGKSTVTDGLALLFGRERMTSALCDWDFFGGNPQPHSHFTLIGTVTDFGPVNDPGLFPQWFHGERAARPVWWHDETQAVSFEDAAPPNATLAAQIALSARYDDEACEFDQKRFFYDGPCNPFTDDHRQVPQNLLHELGVFLLPSSRQWDRLLAFGSSSFIKVLRQGNALPGDVLENLKAELRQPQTKVEESANLQTLLQSAERELRAFLMLNEDAHLLYRPTSLDTLAVFYKA